MKTTQQRKPLFHKLDPTVRMAQLIAERSCNDDYYTKNRAENPAKIKPIYIHKHKNLNEILTAFLSKRKRKHIAVYNPIINNVVANALRSNVNILYSRQNNPSFIKVVDFLAAKGYLVNVIAPPNHYSEKKYSSHFTGTDLLRSKFKLVRYKFTENNKVIQFKDSSKKLISIPHYFNKKVISNEMKFTISYNKFVGKHCVTLNDKVLNPFLFQSFADRNTQRILGGRYYGSDVQTLSSFKRKSIKIDCKRTVELDYSNLHINMLYSLVKVKPPTGDLYAFGGYNRKLNKQLLLRLINSNEKSLHQAVKLSKHPNIKRLNDLYMRGKIKYVDKHVKTIIQGIDHKFDFDDWLASAYKKHQDISRLFGAKHLALTLQRLDSLLIKEVMKASKIKKIVTLPIHDSVICDEEEKDRVKYIMEKAYLDKFKNAIKVA